MNLNEISELTKDLDFSCPVDLPNCNSEVFAKGRCAIVIAGSTMVMIEAVVKEAARVTGFEIDWSYVGGRACVQTLGDPQIVRAVIEKLINFQTN